MSKINNYDDLILERKRLESELAHYKSIITQELDEIKHKVEPITDVVSFFSPSKNPPAIISFFKPEQIWELNFWCVKNFYRRPDGLPSWSFPLF